VVFYLCCLYPVGVLDATHDFTRAGEMEP